MLVIKILNVSIIILKLFKISNLIRNKTIIKKVKSKLIINKNFNKKFKVNKKKAWQIPYTQTIK
jgi:hypothetical protein